MSERVLIESYTAPVRVDREAGIIRDCLLLGKESRNGVSYPDDTRAKAVPLFEGARACLSHPGERTREALRRPRRWEDAVGRYENVRNAPDGVRGDLKVKKRHPYAELLLDEAENAPGDFGLSPAMLGVTSGPAGKERCVEIRVVRSVDVVLEPATARGLFEEEAADGEEGPSAEEAYEAACKQAVAEVVTKALSGEVTPEDAAKQIKDLLKQHLKAFKPDKEGGAEDAADAAEKPSEMEEEYRRLKLEKECRVLLEQHEVAEDRELLALLMDLKDQATRVQHLNYLKRGSLVRKPKSGYSAPPAPARPGATAVDLTSRLFQALRS